MTKTQRVDEEKALIEEIITSPLFSGARLRIMLLRHLFQSRDKPQTVGDLAEEVWDKGLDTFDPNTVRVQCADLRKHLKEFASSYIGTSRLRCDLPPANLAESYRLIFTEIETKWRATHGFWKAHLSSGLNVITVCNEPLFFRDWDERVRKVTRYSDINQEDTDSRKALEKLKQLHPDDFKESLECSHSYLPSGEIFARQRLEEWFDQAAGIKIRNLVSRHMNGQELAETSPILLGNTRTNRFIREILKSEDCAHLAYTIRPERFGVIEIANANENEIEALRRLPPSSVRFGNESAEVVDSPDSARYVFGLVTRIPNVYGEGAITIIAADYTRFIDQIARVATDESLLRHIVEKADWKDSVAPQSFQALLMMRTGIGILDDERRKPELLTWRMYTGTPIERNSPHAA